MYFFLFHVWTFLLALCKSTLVEFTRMVIMEWRRIQRWKQLSVWFLVISHLSQLLRFRQRANPVCQFDFQSSDPWSWLMTILISWQRSIFTQLFGQIFILLEGVGVIYSYITQQQYRVNWWDNISPGLW